jgi:hypothetical protein
MTPKGIQLYYGKHFESCFQAVTRTSKFNFGLSYDEVAAIALPYVVKKGQECIDKDEPLFKVSVLVHGEEKKQFIVVFSVSVIVADVHTFYKLYNMMNADVDGTTLNATRNLDFSQSIRKTLGKSEVDWITSSSSRQNGIAITAKLFPRVKPSAFYVEEDSWLPKAKKTHSAGTNWVSTNDILTSWFFNLCHCDYAFMLVNFRNRLLNLDDKHAGNYSENILYRPDDYDRPLLIRASLTTGGYKRAAQIENRFRKGTHSTPLPSVFTALKNNSAASENWCGAYQNLMMHDCIQLLHIPVIVDYNALPHRNVMYIFKPTAGSIGMLLFERDRLIIDHEYNPLKKNILKLPW